jgi:signal peptidase II
LRILYLTAVLVVLDQVTKLLVKGFTIPLTGFYHEGMYLGQSIPLIGDFLRLTYIENPGMAFGIEIGGRLFITVFSIFASIGIGYYLYRIRNESFVARLALALILAGAIGNLIDRVLYGWIFGEAPLFYGKVVDFVDVDFIDIDLFGFRMYRWAVFNVADSCVSIGVVLMLLFHKKFSEAVEPKQATVADASANVADGLPPKANS